MIIGIPKEIKIQEYRVGMTPASVSEASSHGHRVLVESGAGVGIGCDDGQYRASGADIVASAAEVFAHAEMIVKVKEPQPEECAKLSRSARSPCRSLRADAACYWVAYPEFCLRESPSLVAVSPAIKRHRSPLAWGPKSRF